MSIAVPHARTRAPDGSSRSARLRRRARNAHRAWTTTLHHRLIDKIGAGGMGGVGKDADTALDRQITIAARPETPAADAQRLARLEREAKLAASLNHPEIAIVHGLHHVADIRFVAMKLVEGEDLAERLSSRTFLTDRSRSAE